MGLQAKTAQVVRDGAEIDNSKAPIQKLADSITSWFVPAIIAIAITTFTI